MEGMQSVLGEESGILFLRGSRQRIAEKVVGYIRIESRLSRGAAEPLVGQPSPARIKVREGEMSRLRRKIPKLSGKSRSMRGKTQKGNWAISLGHHSTRRRKALQWIIETQSLCSDRFLQEIAREYLRERTEAQQRVLGGKLVGVGSRLSVSLKEYLMSPNHYEDHSGRSGLPEQLGTQVADALQV